MKFSNSPEDTHVIIGVVKDLTLNPRSIGAGFLYTYKLINEGENLQFVHKTVVDEMPGAIAPFQGRALIGVGKHLRIYDLGKKKLLRKCENKVRLLQGDKEKSDAWKKNDPTTLLQLEKSFPYQICQQGIHILAN